MRGAMGLTLVEFGKHVDIAWQTVQAYESDRCMPPADRLLQIAYATRRVRVPFRWEHVARSLASAERSMPARAA